MEETAPTAPIVPQDPDEKMEEGGAGIKVPEPRRGLFKGQLQRGKGILTTIRPDDPTQIHTVPITDIPKPLPKGSK